MKSPTGNPRSITAQVDFGGGRRGKAKPPAAAGPEPLGRVPRVARLMALAIKFDGLLRSGAVADQAELAELAHVTRARVTQIMNLLHLAPDIQEELLCLPLAYEGRDLLGEHHLRSVAALVLWRDQRSRFSSLLKRSHRYDSRQYCDLTNGISEQSRNRGA